MRNNGVLKGQEKWYLGIVGAIIGTIPGIIIQIILGSLGIISSLTSIVLSLGIIFMYYFFAKDIGKIGAVICIITLVIAIFIGVRLSWTFQLHKELKEYMTLGQCYKDFYKILELCEIPKSKFIGSVAKNYLFGILGIFVMLANFIKSM